MKRLPAIDWQLAAKAVMVFLLLMAVYVPVFVARQAQERETQRARERFASTQVAERLNQSVSTRLKVLELLEHTRSTLDGSDRFTFWSKRIEEKIQGFFAINWIDPRGVITQVVPEDRNSKALGRNLLERNDVKGYLIRSRDQRVPTMTHIVELYQGPLGVTLYLPIYDGNDFKGWINGVFTAEHLLGDLMVTKGFEQSYTTLRFRSNPDRVFTRGTPPGPSVPLIRHEFPLLNQAVEIEIMPDATAPATTPGPLTWWIFVGVLLGSVGLAVLSYLLMASKQRLAQRLDKERVHGILLNLLVHDIINPLLIVRYGVEAAQRLAPAEMQTALGKVQYGVSQISDVIARVKDMRAVESGRFVPTMTDVPINDLIEESRKLFDERLKVKGLTADFELSPANPKISIDRVIFQNNVLNNLLSNAVKFSERGGKVTLRCLEADKKFVALEVRDQGVGMPEDIRRNLFLERAGQSTPGTMGEKGTGIGMLQVHTYMKLFGGKVQVESKTKAQSPEAHGTTFRLQLPRADA